MLSCSQTLLQFVYQDFDGHFTSFSFNKYLLTACHTLGTMQESGDSVMNITQFMCSWILDSGEEMSAVEPIGLGAMSVKRSLNSVLEGQRRVIHGGKGQVATGRLGRT